MRKKRKRLAGNRQQGNQAKGWRLLLFLLAFGLLIGTSFWFDNASFATIDSHSLTTVIRNNWQNPQLVYTLKKHSGTVESLAFSPNSQILASGGGYNDGQIRLWQPKTGKQIAIIPGAQQTAVRSIVISPDGQLLASGSDDTMVNLWNLKTNRFRHSFRQHTTSVLSLAITPDGQVMASGALDGIRLWNLNEIRTLGTLVWFDNRVESLAIAPNSQILASGDSKGVVKFWAFHTGQLLQAFPAHASGVSSVAFTPNGEVLVTASPDRTIKLWNVRSGALIRTLIGHTAAVNAVAVHPDGQTLASAGQDGIRIWQMQTGELVTLLTAHADWVSAVTFSPDGQMLASGGYDRRVMIWRPQSAFPQRLPGRRFPV